MRVIANKPLRGEYGYVVADQEFDVRDDLAEQLLKKGMVRHARPPKVQYETRVITMEAPEVSPREPFRDMPLPDEKPEAVVTESNQLLSVADVPPSRAIDSRGRGRRSGPTSEE